jgi:hypothetical protein
MVPVLVFRMQPLLQHVAFEAGFIYGGALPSVVPQVPAPVAPPCVSAVLQHIPSKQGFEPTQQWKRERKKAKQQKKLANKLAEQNKKALKGKGLKRAHIIKKKILSRKFVKLARRRLSIGLKA